jgi:hypothetical protein
MRMRHIFPHCLTNKRHGFRGGGGGLNIKCVLWFSLQLSSETYRILRITEFRCDEKRFIEYPLFASDFNESWILSTDLRKIWNFMKFRPVWAELFHAGGRTDRNDEANRCFSQFCERAWKLKRLPRSSPTEVPNHSCPTNLIFVHIFVLPNPE